MLDLEGFKWVAAQFPYGRRLRRQLRYEASCFGIDQLVVSPGLGDCDVVFPDGRGLAIRKAGVGRVWIYDAAKQSVDHLIINKVAEIVAARLRKLAITEIEIAKLWLIGDKIASGIRSPDDEAKPLHQGGLARAGVRGGDENHLPGAKQKVDQFRIAVLLIGGAKDLLDDCLLYTSRCV